MNRGPRTEGRARARDGRLSRLGPRSSVLGLLLCAPLSAQQASGYTETITSHITSRTASAELGRTLVREIVYRASMRGDTLVMQATMVRLEEQSERGVVRHDTDGFTGGRWKLLPTGSGGWQVVERPFVPPALVEVNDLAAAMDDFFPPAPPLLPRDGRFRDSAGRAWRRLADSAAVQRFRWERASTLDTTAVARDTILLRIEESVREVSQLQLDARGAPSGWTREIETEMLSRGAGRGVRATVRQRIEVRRLP